MAGEPFDRRSFLKTAVASGVGAAAPTAALVAEAEPASQPAAPTATVPASGAPAGYIFLHPTEAAFVEALVDHMIPADALTGKGTDLGINIYIDRALASGWGQGDRFYKQGPWKEGLPTQGYQLPLTPAALCRAGIEATDHYCRQTYGKSFDQLAAPQKEELLIGLDAGKIAFADGPPAKTFFNSIYQLVMEGMFADPIYGGNRDKAVWKMIGFPGVVEVNQRNITDYKNKPFKVEPTSIADMS
jgi:gluconate 2-dehydrogenase gamma chain